MKKGGLLCFFYFYSLISFCQGTGTELLYTEARNFFKIGQKEKALGIYESIFKLDPKQAEALEWMTFLYYELDQPSKAAWAGSKLCLLKPDNATIQNNTCYYFTIAGEPELAESYGKKAVELNPYQYNHMLNLGHTYLLRARNDEAIYWYIKALQWVSSKEKFETSFMVDLKYLATKNLVSKDVAGKFMDGLSGEFEAIQKNMASNRLLDSILFYNERRNSTEIKEKLIDWKKEFILAESKQEVVRYNVMANFLRDIGMDEFKKRNRSIAMDFWFDQAEKMLINEGDSLEQAKLLIQLSRQLLTILQSENKFSLNSAALEYAKDAIEIIEKYNFRELEVPSLFQLSECYFQNKDDLAGKKTLTKLLNGSSGKKDSLGILYACYGLSKYF